MSDTLKIYIAILIFGFIVTMVRVLIASGDSKGKQQEAQRKREENDNRLNEFVQQRGGHVDTTFSTGNASAALDKENGVLYVIAPSLPGGQARIDLKEVASVAMVNKSEDYKYLQKLEQLHSGVDRGPMADPYRGHSMREVKDAHQRFDAWQGSIVYGVELKMNDGSTPVQIAFYRADGTVFWSEDQNLQSCKSFAKQLDQAVLDAK